jgi:hypothetical protein
MLIDPFDLYKEYDADRVRTLDALVSRLGRVLSLAFVRLQNATGEGEKGRSACSAVGGRRPPTANIVPPTEITNFLPFSCCL